MGTNDVARIPFTYSIATGVDIWNELCFTQQRISDLEYKIEQMAELNALGASREYRTPEIHRAHTEDFASKERELNLLKNHLEILKAIYYGLETAYIQIRPI